MHRRIDFRRLVSHGTAKQVDEVIPLSSLFDIGFQRTLKIGGDGDAGLLQPLSCVFKSRARQADRSASSGSTDACSCRKTSFRVESSISADGDSWVTAPDCFSQSASLDNALWVSATASNVTSYDRETE